MLTSIIALMIAGVFLIIGSQYLTYTLTKKRIKSEMTRWQFYWKYCLVYETPNGATVEEFAIMKEIRKYIIGVQIFSFFIIMIGFFLINPMFS
jgi:hypothetical protein